MKITLDQAREAFSYCPEKGQLTRKSTGRPVGSAASSGHLYVHLGKITVPAARVAWALHYGETPQGEVVCIDGCFANLRADNLRLAKAGGRNAHARLRRDNRSGYKGVHWDARRGKWRAEICVSGASRHLGYFGDPAEAHAAYMAEARKIHGEFASDGRVNDASQILPSTGN